MKVKKKHLIGEIADFPKHVVQAMCDEQVRQGSPFDPSVFARNKYAEKRHGGFEWEKSLKGNDFWLKVINHKKFHLLPKPKGHPRAKLMKQYAKDAKTHERPWELWEFRFKSWDSGRWESLYGQSLWNKDCEYRRKSQATQPETPPKQPTPREIIEAYIERDGHCWCGVSDVHQGRAREEGKRYLSKILRVSDNGYFHGEDCTWEYAVPFNPLTCEEIVGLPE